MAEVGSVKGRCGWAARSPAHTCHLSARVGLWAPPCWSAAILNCHLLIKALQLLSRWTHLLLFEETKESIKITTTSCLPLPNTSAGPSFSDPHGPGMTDPHPTGGQHSLLQRPVPPPQCPLRPYFVHFTFSLMSPGFSLFLIPFFTKKLRNFPLFTVPLGFPFCPLLSSAA